MVLLILEGLDPVLHVLSLHFVRLARAKALSVGS